MRGRAPLRRGGSRVTVNSQNGGVEGTATRETEWKHVETKKIIKKKIVK